MSISISTKDFVKSKNVLIDGMDWEFIAPGAGLSLELSRLAREVTKEDATSEEQTKMIETMFEYYGSIFRDKTKNNTQVNKWLRETPIETISLVVTEIQKSE